uniref:Uncharacterized protein n=1 Tax=Kalanchoe fedtschenkoi TaxID=63787 RepID=A0A7N0UJI0_KALFE
MSSSFAEVRARVVELLIVSAERLNVSPIVKYSALSLFADRLCRSLSDPARGSGADIDHWLLRPLTESSLQLFALISLWISCKMDNSRPLSVKRLKSLGDNMIKDQHFTTRDYIEAVSGFEIGVLNTLFAHLENLYLQFIGIAKMGEMVKFEACTSIMDLLYEKEIKPMRHSDPRILAASILAIPKQMCEFPLLPWVTFRGCFNEDDVLKLVGDILKLVLCPSNMKPF